MAEIKLKNLTKRWGNFVGVDNFNLDIQDKEFLVLVDMSELDVVMTSHSLP